MRRIQTDVLVVGGGATGTGVLRDLAMRGFRAVLVERRDLASGTTGRYHGLLHSGARYAVNDPPAALECINENRILRTIIPQCLEDTGGLFVTTPGDDASYIPLFLGGCQAAGIPVEEVPVATMLREEPRLNPAITRCFRVPDASADSFLAADLNARSAKEHGAEILPYHEVTKLLRQESGSPRIVGAVCMDLASGEEIQIHSDFVVNASGAWAGRIAASAEIEIPMRPGKGTMVAVNHRVVHSVINRCKPPSDGDILVPAHTVSIIGTTDEPVADPDSLGIEPWEIALMFEEGERMVPGFRDLRILRAWTGVRPLYQPTESAHSRRITRAHVLIDHEFQDGVGGLLTITGGKWTTYRLMAQVTVDKLCEKLNVSRPCRTHLEPLAGSESFHSLGARLRHVETGQLQDSLICECELATEEDITKAIRVGRARTIDDVRRDTRLGMGPCQGSFCTYRIAGMLGGEEESRVADINSSLREFLQARWRGLRPVLSGSQLKQERLAEMIYANVMAIDSLPGRQSTVFANPADVPDWREDGTTGHSSPGRVSGAIAPQDSAHGQATPRGPSTFSSSSDILVIGGGLAGLMTAWSAARRGRTVRVITHGQGALLFSAGTVDILGHDPENKAVVHDLRASLERLIQRDAQHPYTLAGLANLEAGVTEFARVCEEAGYPMAGSLQTNSLHPTACGGLRPASLLPESMSAGVLDPRDRETSFLIVGLAGFLDFFPALVASNLQDAGYPTDWITLEMRLPSRRRSLNSKVLAQFFDDPVFCDDFCDLLVSRLPARSSTLRRRLGFPAVLGLADTRRIREQIEHKTGCAVFEIPGLPPSVPGLRLQNCLVRALRNAGVEVLDGMEAISVERTGNRISKVWTEAASRSKPHTAREFVLATGGILSGGLVVRPGGQVVEPVFGLPVTSPGEATRALFLDPGGHPVFSTGVRVNDRFQPIDEERRISAENLFAVGSILGGPDVVRDASMEGIALATAHAVGELL